MARILGEVGRYVSQQATNLRSQRWVAAANAIGGLDYAGAFSPAVVCVTAVLRFANWCCRRLAGLEFERAPWRRAATAKASVRLRLEEFPREFRRFHGLTVSSGTFDHVVVGPTGVFIVNIKRWRGIAAADGHGELTRNGQPLDKPCVAQFLARVAEVKEKIGRLAPGLEPYFQALFVFTAARVDASFGTTSTLHCIRDEQLYDYIVHKRFGRKLPPAEVEQIAQAFETLANRAASPDDSTALTHAPRSARAPHAFVRMPGLEEVSA